MRGISSLFKFKGGKNYLRLWWNSNHSQSHYPWFIIIFLSNKTIMWNPVVSHVTCSIHTPFEHLPHILNQINGVCFFLSFSLSFSLHLGGFHLLMLASANFPLFKERVGVGCSAKLQFQANPPGTKPFILMLCKREGKNITEDSCINFCFTKCSRKIKCYYPMSFKSTSLVPLVNYYYLGKSIMTFDFFFPRHSRVWMIHSLNTEICLNLKSLIVRSVKKSTWLSRWKMGLILTSGLTVYHTDPFSVSPTRAYTIWPAFSPPCWPCFTSWHCKSLIRPSAFPLPSCIPVPIVLRVTDDMEPSNISFLLLWLEMVA